MSVRVTTLDNGLRVATDAMTTVETVSVCARVGVGTRFETANRNGISHLIEHMVFKGTARRNAYRINEEIENVGGVLNAFTDWENTTYFAKVLKDDLGLAMDIIADIVQNPLLDPEELNRERDVVVQEISRVNDTPDDVIFDIFQTTAYPDQPLGRPILGTEDLIKAMPRKALADYLNDHYHAPNMIVAAAGNVHHDDLVALAGDVYADLEGRRRETFQPAVYRGGDFRESRDLAQLHLVLGLRAFGCKDPDFYALSILSTLLGGGMSSRLYREIREKRGLAYSIFSNANCYLDSGLFSIYVGASGDKGAEVVSLICEGVKRVLDDLDKDEIHRARAQLKSSILMALESTTGRCNQLARQLAIFGRSISPAEIVEEIEAVDKPRVLATLSRLLESEPTVTALGAVENVPDYDFIAERLTA